MNYQNGNYNYGGINFNPYYPGQLPPTQYPYVNQNTTNVIVVSIQGLDAAKAYPLNPNTRAYFFDTEADFIYIKEMGSDGMQKGGIRILKCTEITENELHSKTDEDKTIKLSELDEYLSLYLQKNNYRPWIPKSERSKSNE